METKPIEFERTPVRRRRREKRLTEHLSDLSRTLVQTGALLWQDVTGQARTRPRPAVQENPDLPRTRSVQAPHLGQPGGAARRVDPKIRAFGRARLDIASRVQNHEDWEALWVAPRHGFPFTWGPSWRHCFEYQVDEFAAEVGFFVDVLGFTVTAIGPEYAMFSSPDQAFHFSVVPTPPGGLATPPEAVRMQFQVADVQAASRALKRRGVSFEQEPPPLNREGGLSRGYFRTPNGICIDLMGAVSPVAPHQPHFSRQETRPSRHDFPTPSPALKRDELEPGKDTEGPDPQATEDQRDDEEGKDWPSLEYTDDV